MRRIILTFLVVLTSWSHVLGQPKQTPSIEVHVAGMVCAFCIQGIEKTLLAIKAVRSIDINLKTKIVTVIPKQVGAITDDHIRKAIDDAGYEVTQIVRSVPALPADEVTSSKLQKGQQAPQGKAAPAK